MYILLFWNNFITHINKYLKNVLSIKYIMGRAKKEEIENRINNFLKELDERGVLYLSVSEIIKREGVSRVIAQIIYNGIMEYIINNLEKYTISKIGSSYIIIKRNVEIKVNKNFLQGIIFAISLLYRLNKDNAIQLINAIKGYGINLDVKDIINADELLQQIVNSQYEAIQNKQTN